MRLDKATLATAAAAVLSLTASGARSVAWPTDYEAQLAARVAEVTPSGDNMAASGAYASFNLICDVVAFAYFGDALRNCPVMGMQLIFR